MKISTLSKWLVGLQMMLIVLIGISGKWYPNTMVGILAFSSGWLLVIVAIMAFQQSKFTVFPEPSSGATLISNGVYAYIRHPFYTAVLLVTGALVGETFTWWRLLIWCMLLAVLLVKINHEENLLDTRFDTYKHYKLKTKKLIPFIW